MQDHDYSHSKYKYLMGKSMGKDSGRLDGIQMPVAGVDGNQIVANTKFIATPWKGGGGQVLIVPTGKTVKFNGMEPKIAGHTGPIQDLSFSPFQDDMLATCSTDATIKLWEIPEDGLTSKITDSIAVMRGHQKKITLMKWHPTTQYTIASASLDGSVKVWDVQGEADKYTFRGLQGNPQSLEWNEDGSLLGCITKGKKLYVNDPRTSDNECLVTNSHEGIKTQKLQWAGKSKILTTGANDFNEREYIVHDIRNLQTPLVQKKLDNEKLQMTQYLDYDTGVLYIINKGHNFTSFFHYNRTNDEITPMDKYQGEGIVQGIGFLPKKDLNFNASELARGIRFNSRSAEWISFILPRKGGCFNDDVYPPCYAGKSVMKFEEYASGVNKDPELMVIDGESSSSPNTKRRQSLFMAKAQAKEEFAADAFARMNARKGTVAVGKVGSGGGLLEKPKPMMKKTFMPTPITEEKEEGRGNIVFTKLNPVSPRNPPKSSASSADTKKFEEEIKNLKTQVKDLQKKLEEEKKKNGAMPTLAYYDIRGVAQAIRYQLIHQGVEFIDKKFPTNEDKSSTSSSDEANLPYFIDVNGSKITDVIEIQKYIAQKYQPELLGASDKERQTCEKLATDMTALKKRIVDPCYNDDANKEKLIEAIFKEFETIKGLLDSKNFLLGKQPCFVDFSLYETLVFATLLVGKDMVAKTFPELISYQTRVEDLPNMKKHLTNNVPPKSNVPFNMRYCKINVYPNK